MNESVVNITKEDRDFSQSLHNKAMRCLKPLPLVQRVHLARSVMHLAQKEIKRLEALNLEDGYERVYKE